MGEIQLLLRSRDPHIRQSTLLFELLGVAQRPHVRKDAFLHPGDEDHRILEALGVVKRHQRHRTGFLHPIDVRDQRCRLEEELEAATPAEFLPPLVAEICHRSVLFEFGCDRQQLLEVLGPAEGLQTTVGLELGKVSGVIEHRLKRGAGSGSSRNPQHTQQRHEFSDLLRRPGGEASVLAGPFQSLEVGDALRLGEPIDMTDAGGSDSALRHIDYPLHRYLIRRVDQRPQIRHDVLDLAPVVELGTADHLIRDGVSDENLFENPALSMGAVEDGGIGQAPADILESSETFGDEGGLVMFVLGLIHGDRFTGAEVGPEMLRGPPPVVCNHGIGSVQDRLSRSVVTVEHDHSGISIVLFELEDVAHIGATERIDALVGIADDAQVAMFGRQ